MTNRIFAVFLSVSALLAATTYDVGTGKPYTSLNSVPWESLQAGDIVQIYYRSTPYKEKFVINRQGTETSPIIVRGILGPNGERPIIDGNGATTRTKLSYWNPDRNVIKIGGSSVPGDTMPRYIIIENLDVRSGRPPYTFKAANGTTMSYIANAAAIQVEKGEHIQIRNCALHDSGNGLFIGSIGSTPSRDFLIEGNHIYDNGNAGSSQEHNNYTTAIGIVFQYNYFGPVKAGSSGSNLKDRSAGTVIRYNWIQGGNREIDLVDSGGAIRSDPSYASTFVYGNVIIEHEGPDNRQMVHYGGDSGTTANYRKGTLHFYNNTMISTRTSRTVLFRLSTNEETCDFRNNIAYVTAAGSNLATLEENGRLLLSHNWFKTGKVGSFASFNGSIVDDNTSIFGTSPGFANEAAMDYRLASNSAAIDAGAALHSSALPTHEPVWHYKPHQKGEARISSPPLDLGAYEYSSGPRSRCDLDGDLATTALDLQLLVNVVMGVDSADPAGYGDVNLDGRVDSNDVQPLVDSLVGARACPLI